MNRQKARLALAVLMVFLFPIIYYYFSPYLIIMGAAEGIIAGDVIAFAGLFVTSLFFGRAWCGWICPAGATQELCSKVNGREFNGKKRNLVKYFIWAPWIAIAIMMLIAAGGVKVIDPLYQTWNGISVQDLPSGVMFAVIAGAIAAFALAAGKRAACHTICWMAPFMIIGRKIRNSIGWPALQLEADNNKCINCKTCTRSCSMSLDVNAMVQNRSMENPECILCGKCVDNCPKGAIRYSFGKKAPLNQKVSSSSS
jgi:ferredoxin-type protein NapH